MLCCQRGRFGEFFADEEGQQPFQEDANRHKDQQDPESGGHRQGQLEKVVEQQHRHIEADGGSDSQKAPELIQRPAGLPDGGNPDGAHHQIHQQGLLLSGQRHSAQPVEEEHRNARQGDNDSVGGGQSQRRWQEAAGNPFVVGLEGDEEGGIAFDHQVDEGDLNGQEGEIHVQDDAHQAEKHRIDGLDKEHTGGFGDVVHHPASFRQNAAKHREIGVDEH